MPVLDDKDLTLGETQTQIFKLSEVTRADNARFFEGNLNAVPTHAISMGLKTILESRKVLVMAFGQKKAEAVKNAVIGSVTSVVPASYLLRHSDCTFVVDMAAASDLIWEITQQGKGAQLKPASRFGIQAIELEIEQKS
jgi:glucosamine-6-phosphate deaminase